jgi:hypothetical protein
MLVCFVIIAVRVCFSCFPAAFAFGGFGRVTKVVPFRVVEKMFVVFVV